MIPRITTKMSAQVLSLTSLLDKRDKKIFILIGIAQSLTNMLDIIGVAAVGMIGSISIRGVQSQGAGDRVSKVLQYIHFEKLNLNHQVLFLGILASIALIAKTVISMNLSRKTLFFLSKRGAVISRKLFEFTTSSGIMKINDLSVQRTVFALGGGVTNIVVGVLAVLPLIIADISLLTIFIISLIIIDAKLTTLTLLIFTIVGLAIQKNIFKKIRIIGKRFTESTIEANTLIEQVILSYRELLVKNQIEEYGKRFNEKRNLVAKYDAVLRFLPNTSKYVFEITIVCSSLIFAAYQFTKNDASTAVAVLTLFIAAIFRMGPAFLRIQQSVVQIKSSLSNSQDTLNLIESSLNNTINQKNENEFDAPLQNESKIFTGEIEIKNITFAYESRKNILNDISLVLRGNLIHAIVGPSGAGKSTLMDLMLGILHPDRGQIRLNGLHPTQVIKTWPGKISYVPQDIRIYKGTFKENVCFGFDSNSFSDQEVIEVLKRVHLFELVMNFPEGIHADIGERGTNLSGGQKQRLGLARALITKPSLLFLDEATSAIDGNTENKLSQELLSLKAEMTVVLIAHRLSTVAIADSILYLDQGEIQYFGNFEGFKKIFSDDELARNILE